MLPNSSRHRTPRMGAKGVASSAAGAAALVYAVLSGRLSPDGAEEAPSRGTRHGRRGVDGESEARWPESAPASWREAAAVAARTVRFAYGETLGKWPFGDIAFGISHYMRLQGNLQHEYTCGNCVPLEGPGVRQELIVLLRYLRLCRFFSKEHYEVFLEFGGYGQNDILIRKSKAKLMKPTFTVVRDESTRCFLLFIRGAISVKDRLTAATAAEVPFHHAVSQEGRGSCIVVGHAHCGMVAAARWVADQAIPCLSRAVERFPDYKIKVMTSSWAPDLQEHIQQKRLLSFINHSVDFMRSYIPFVSSPSSKVADVDMLQSWAAKVEMKRSEGLHEVVKKHSALPRWRYVATKNQTFDEAEKGTDGAHMEQLLEGLRSSSSGSLAPRHCQLYPPGRIMHMVALPILEEQGSQSEGVALYETPRDMYRKIRLATSMIRDHYMPRYIETMEMLIDKLAENDEPPSDTNDVRLE